MNRRQLLAHATTALAALGTAPMLLAASWAAGQKLPDLAKFGLTGALPKTAGKVVYLDFWASWCAPCRASFPVLSQWYEQLRAKGLVVIGVCVDEKAEDMKAALAKTPASFPIVHDAKQALVAAANVETMPSSFIIDKSGVIRHAHKGFKGRDADALLKQINALL